MSSDDPDRAAILARRQRFVAIALSGLATGGVACSPQPCLEVQPQKTAPTESKSKPQPCLDIKREPDSVTPRPCLNVAPTGDDGAPRPCLDVDRVPERGEVEAGRAEEDATPATPAPTPPTPARRAR